MGKIKVHQLAKVRRLAETTRFSNIASSGFNNGVKNGEFNMDPAAHC